MMKDITKRDITSEIAFMFVDYFNELAEIVIECNETGNPLQNPINPRYIQGLVNMTKSNNNVSGCTNCGPEIKLYKKLTGNKTDNISYVYWFQTVKDYYEKEVDRYFSLKRTETE